MDRLYLKDIACRCRIGVSALERSRPQLILLDLCLEADLSAAGESDRLEDAVDYYALEKRLRALAQQSRFKLVERLAEALAQAALSFDRRVRRVTLSVRKAPAAMPRTREVSVEITRGRRSGGRRLSNAGQGGLSDRGRPSL